MSARRAGLALLGLLASGAAWAGEAVLRAQTLELRDGVATGAGGVEVTLDDQRATGARFRYDLESGLLTVDDGTWTRPEGQLSFSRAEIDLGAGQGVVLEGSYRGQDGRLQVQGDALSWLGEGELSGEGVRVSTCACAPAPWAVEAREVHVRLDEEVRFTGGWISICDRRVLPVPAGSIPLAERRSGLLLPLVGYGEDGLRLGLPVYLTLGPAADWTLTPELRTARGPRLLSELRYALPQGQGGSLGAAGGWDLLQDAPRGALSWQHRQATGRARIGADALVWSDPDYGADLGDSFLARRAPWTEALLHAGYGPLRVLSDTFQGDEALGQHPVGAALAWGGGLGPLAARGGAGWDAFADGEGALQSDPAASRARVEGQLSGGRELGAVRVEGALAGRGASWLDGAPWGQGQAALGLAVPMWAPSGAGYLLLDAGLAADGALTWGEPDLRRPDEALWSAWRLGPTLSLRRVTVAGVPISGRVQLPWGEDGLDPQGELRLQAGPWAARAQADRALQEGSAGWDDGQLRVMVGAARDEALAVARGELAWTLPGKLASLRPSWRGLVDLEEGGLQSQTLALRWRPLCDCVELELSGATSEDRALPDLGARLEIW